MKKQESSSENQALREVVAEELEVKEPGSTRKTVDLATNREELKEAVQARAPPIKPADGVDSQLNPAPALRRHGYTAPVAAAMIPKPTRVPKKESVQGKVKVMAPPPAPSSNGITVVASGMGGPIGLPIGLPSTEAKDSR